MKKERDQARYAGLDSVGTRYRFDAPYKWLKRKKKVRKVRILNLEEGGYRKS